MNRITSGIAYVKPLGQLASASFVQASVAALVSKTLGAGPLCGALVATEYVLAKRGLSCISAAIKGSPFLAAREIHWRVSAGFALGSAVRFTCGRKKFEPAEPLIISLPLLDHPVIFRETCNLIAFWVPWTILEPLGGVRKLAECFPSVPLANVVLSHVGLTLAARVAKALGNRSFNVAPPAPVLAALFVSLVGTTLLAQALQTSYRKVGPWLRYV